MFSSHDQILLSLLGKQREDNAEAGERLSPQFGLQDHCCEGPPKPHLFRLISGETPI